MTPSVMFLMPLSHCLSKEPDLNKQAPGNVLDLGSGIYLLVISRRWGWGKEPWFIPGHHSNWLSL